jgi:hypothetical protein
VRRRSNLQHVICDQRLLFCHRDGGSTLLDTRHSTSDIVPAGLPCPEKITAVLTPNDELFTTYDGVDTVPRR